MSEITEALLEREVQSLAQQVQTLQSIIAWMLDEPAWVEVMIPIGWSTDKTLRIVGEEEHILVELV